MCTLSWLLSPQEFHLFFNRDELLSRKPEIPPRHFQVKGQQILAPLDGDTGQGTWLGMSQQGILLCLLNYYPQNYIEASSEYCSRGELIPRLLSNPEALRNAKNSLPDLGDYRPFTLLYFDLHNKPDMRMYRWDGRLEVSFKPPPIVTSSSYRSQEVEAWRRDLFYRQYKAELNFHWNFHRSHAGAQGVCLHREAGPKPGKTVSLCHVAHREQGFELKYFPGSPCALPARREAAVGHIYRAKS